MKQSPAEREREWWLRVKARGKQRFLVQQFLQPLLLGLVILTAISVKRGFDLVVWLGTLPVILLYGYLNGRWRWNDFEKKFPE